VTTDRRIRWPACRNVRDLGGLPTIDGQRVARRALIRADGLDRLTPAGVEAVRRDGVCRIIDLRSVEEARRYPSPFAGDPWCRSLPLIDPQRELTRDLSVERTALATYRGSVIRNAPSIAATIAAIADAPAGTVVVHCAEGKDRTGMIVALVLRVAGVPTEVIAQDYAYSAECLGQPDSCAPETIVGMLSQVDDLYGNISAYLHAHGLSGAQISRLRSRLGLPASGDSAVGRTPLA